MSRLYEALKEASRFRGNRNGAAGLWETWGVDGGEQPPAENTSPAAQPPKPASGELAPSSLESNTEWLPAEVSSEVGEQVSRTVEEDEPGILAGKDSNARLDYGARLIPNAVDSRVVEYYRRLRTKILQQQQVKPFRSLVITSAGPQEGKSVTVMNLALSFSTLPEFKVLVIDGDMRKGTLGNWLGVDDGRPGLSNLFNGSATLEDVVLRSDQVPMHFMVRGNANVHDLHPSHFANHFQKLGELFDLVLIDSPPVNLLADVQILAANSDAVLLVARAFSTSRKSFEKAVQDLSPFRLIGAVLNAGVAPKSGRYSGYY